MTLQNLNRFYQENQLKYHVLIQIQSIVVYIGMRLILKIVNKINANSLSFPRSDRMCEYIECQSCVKTVTLVMKILQGNFMMKLTHFHIKDQ